MALVVFTASIIQLSPRETFQYGHDVFNRYKKLKQK